MALRLNNGVSDQWMHWDGNGTNIKTDGNTDWCMGGWFYWDTDAGINEYAAAIGPVTSGAGAVHGIRVSSTTNLWQTTAAAQTEITPATTGQWIYLACGATTNASGAAWHGTSTTLTQVSGQANSATAMDCIILGHNPASGNSSFRGRIAHLRVWSGVLLSTAEWEAEMVSATAVQTANLFAAYEFPNDASTFNDDSSVNGRDLTRIGFTGLDNWIAGPLTSSQSNAPRASLLRMLRSA
jgi:hypothetical protein